MTPELDTLFVRNAARQVQDACHEPAKRAGWWTDLATGNDLTSGVGEKPKVNVPEKLCLIHSEVSEAMEGHRKGLQDDKLPHRSMLEVELADVVIRCFDLAGGLSLDLPGAIAEKLEFNAKRKDHTLEARMAPGGKAF
jgi:NTP pyrophosphatase (non-canonical NTP hydrolase)